MFQAAAHKSLKGERTKRVRFSDASNRASTPESPAESPSRWSTSSLTSSSVSSSPDNNNHLQVNLFLAAGASLGITFDAALQPLDSLAAHSCPVSVNSSSTRNLLLWEPVTTPPTQSLILLTDLLPWYIKIEASIPSNDFKSHAPFHLKIPHHSYRNTPPSFVTIADLLSGIFDALQRPITTAEFSSLAPYTRTEVAEQFYRRLDGIKDVQERNRVKSLGVRRVDVLLGKTLFMGLDVLEDGSCPSLLLHLK